MRMESQDSVAPKVFLRERCIVLWGRKLLRVVEGHLKTRPLFSDRHPDGIDALWRLYKVASKQTLRVQMFAPTKTNSSLMSKRMHFALRFLHSQCSFITLGRDWLTLTGAFAIHRSWNKSRRPTWLISIIALIKVIYVSPSCAVLSVHVKCDANLTSEKSIWSRVCEREREAGRRHAIILSRNCVTRKGALIIRRLKRDILEMRAPFRPITSAWILHIYAQRYIQKKASRGARKAT